VSAGAVAGVRGRPVPASSRRTLSNLGVYGALALLVLVLAVLEPTFLTASNLANIGRQTTLLAIAAFAMTFVIIAGEIDLSVGAVASLLGVLTATFLAEGLPFPVALGAAVAAGALIGLVNGLVVVRGRVASFIVTLGMLNVVQGLAFQITQGSTVDVDSDAFRATFATGTLLGVPAPVVLGVLLLAVLHVLLRHTRFGANVYAVGSDARAARLVGVPVDRTRALVFVLSGVLMAFAAAVLTARVGNARPDAALGLEFDAIAAVVIGGTAFSGGRGTLLRTVGGALLIGVLNNGLALLDVQYYAQLVVKGVIIVVAVLLDRWAR
jgi:ribose transport system permease protein